MRVCAETAPGVRPVGCAHATVVWNGALNPGSGGIVRTPAMTISTMTMYRARIARVAKCGVAVSSRTAARVRATGTVASRATPTIGATTAREGDWNAVGAPFALLVLVAAAIGTATRSTVPPTIASDPCVAIVVAATPPDPRLPPPSPPPGPPSGPGGDDGTSTSDAERNRDRGIVWIDAWRTETFA